MFKLVVKFRFWCAFNVVCGGSGQITGSMFSGGSGMFSGGKEITVLD